MLKIDEQIYFVLNSIQEGMLIYNQEGRIKYCNYAMQKMTGYNEDELLEESPDKLFNNFFELYEDNIRKINLYEGNEILETVLYRKNKTCFPVEVKINKIK